MISAPAVTLYFAPASFAVSYLKVVPLLSDVAPVSTCPSLYTFRVPRISSFGIVFVMVFPASTVTPSDVIFVR